MNPRYKVILGNMYFLKFDGGTYPTFVIDDQPGASSEAYVFDKYEDAKEVADTISGVVVHV
ncbi:hypothetical protein [Lactococcus garvieae]|uniref:hypothetical protein n=1 Tax=Lactococcus garvieae TaxID=1363 RepID=UPI002550FBE6|nr:hypothetical protein [Lactococcus garvieae]